MISLEQAALATNLCDRRGCGPLKAGLADEQGLELWRSRAALVDDARFTRRLCSDSLDLAEVRAWFAGAAPMLFAPPDWLTWLSRVQDCFSREESVEEYPFAHVLAPFVDRSLADLDEQSSTIPDLDVYSVFGHAARIRLGARLFDLAARVLVFEMHRACSTPEALADSPAARYDAFVARLLDGDLERLLDDYPVLARLLATTCSSWVASALELISRLRSDASQLQEWSGGETDFTLLRRADSHLGDPHRQGRTVWRLDFDIGSVIYKPRSLGVDATFRSLLCWFNRRGVAYPFRTLNILDRGTYGWMECVSAQPCSDLADVARYYRRLGGLIGMVHLLEGTDFHSTNLIAAGEHPVLIDLEGLLHPRLNRLEVGTASEAAQRFLNDSPLRTGLIPTWQNETPDRPGVDISGADAHPDQLVRRQVWEFPYTSEMRLSTKWRPLGIRANHVVLDGQRIPAAQYEKAIVEGFHEIWDLSLRHRNILLSPNGPIRAFATSRTRFIFQNTATYRVLLDAALHPTFLRNGIERDAALDRLWITATDDDRRDALLAAARNALWHGDLPYFQVAPDSRDIDTSERVVADLLDDSSLDVVLGQIQKMNPDLVERCAAVIKASLATVGSSRLTAATSPMPDRASSNYECDWIGEALAIGERFLHTAHHYGSCATWTGVVFAGRNWRVAPLPATLYDGLGGVILFIAYLISISGDRRLVTLRDDAARTLVSQLDESRFMPVGPGAFSGWGGILYVWSHLQSLEPDCFPQSVIERSLSEIERGIETDTAFDWVEGIAGSIAALLGRYAQSGDERALDIATRCGRRLLATAEACHGGLGWRRPADPIALAGMAHGASGIALALARLGEETGDSAFLAAARAALEYERSLFDPVAGNWPDLRNQEGEPSSMTAWCHGAAGIGMARAQLIGFDQTLTSEADIAIKAVLARGFGHAPCLCHGDFGNLDLLIQAGRLEQARAIANAIHVSYPDWTYGDAIHAHAPGLMVGRAGVGYQLLRLAQPDAIPSPLTLSPPRQSTAGSEAQRQDTVKSDAMP